MNFTHKQYLLIELQNKYNKYSYNYVKSYMKLINDYKGKIRQEELKEIKQNTLNTLKSNLIFCRKLAIKRIEQLKNMDIGLILDILKITYPKVHMGLMGQFDLISFINEQQSVATKKDKNPEQTLKSKFKNYDDLKSHVNTYFDEWENALNNEININKGE